MKKEVSGWICRTWIEKPGQGWTSTFERFDTEEEAREYGRIHNSLKDLGETSRDFEVFEDLGSQF